MCQTLGKPPLPEPNCNEAGLDKEAGTEGTLTKPVLSWC